MSRRDPSFLASLFSEVPNRFKLGVALAMIVIPAMILWSAGKALLAWITDLF